MYCLQGDGRHADSHLGICSRQRTQDLPQRSAAAAHENRIRLRKCGKGLRCPAVNKAEIPRPVLPAVFSGKFKGRIDEPQHARRINVYRSTAH